MAEKRGWLNRIIMGSDNNPDFTDRQLATNRWALWWDVVKSRFGSLVKLNLLTLLFFIPLILVVIYFAYQKEVYGAIIPATGNFGIGFPAVDNAQELFRSMNLSVNINQFLWMMPSFLVVAIGLCGCLYVSRKLAWGEGVMIGANFKEGIKQNWKNYLGASVILAMSFFAMTFCFFGLDYYRVDVVISTILRVVGVVQFVFMLIVFMYFTTQSVNYTLSFTALIKNSFLFAFALLPQSLFFLALSAIPFVMIIFLSDLFVVAFIGWILMLIVGVSNLGLVWTVFTHWVYDKYVTEHVQGAKKNKNMYVRTHQDDVRDEIDYVRSRNTIYGDAYASRRLSSIDKGMSVTPLATTFRRSDLEKLQQEKETLKREVESEREAIETEIKAKIEERELQEQAQAQGKKHKKPKKK